MSKELNAQASASGIPGITSQDPTTTKTQDQNIGRNPSDLGNKESETCLTQVEKDQLIQAAIQTRASYNLKEWGNTDLFNLLCYGEPNYIGRDGGRDFFTDLLLFVAQPHISRAFNKEVPDGLKKIGKLLNFFVHLNENNDFSEWLDTMRLEFGLDNEDHYTRIAKKYLTGADLEMVLSLEEKPKPAAHPWYMTQSEENPVTLTDNQLVEALDRYYPGKQWPADKKTIATHEKMRSNLTYREIERLSLLAETPEQKQKRLVDAAVYSELNGPTIPALIRSVGEKVDAAIMAPKVLGPDTEIQFRWDKVKAQPLSIDTEETRSPSSINKLTGAVRKRTGAVTPKQPVKAPARSGLSKKPAPGKTSSSSGRKPVKQPAKKTSTSKKA